MRTSSRALARGVAATLATLAALASAAHPTSAQLLRPQYASIGGAVVAATPLAQGQVVRGAVLLKVEPGLHVNANPASEDWLIATEVSLEGGDGVTLQRAFYPAPLEKEFGFYTGALKVWEGDVVIGVEIDIAGDTAPGGRDLQLKVRYQACNDEACFAPADATFALPVSIAPAGTPARAVDSPLLRQAPFPQATR